MVLGHNRTYQLVLMIIGENMVLIEVPKISSISRAISSRNTPTVANPDAGKTQAPEEATWAPNERRLVSCRATR